MLKQARLVAQVSKPAVSPISKSARRPNAHGSQVWKAAIQQTWKSAPLCFQGAPLCSANPEGIEIVQPRVGAPRAYPGSGAKKYPTPMGLHHRHVAFDSTLSGLVNAFAE